MWGWLAFGYVVVVVIYGVISGLEFEGWAKRYTAGELAVMVIFWPLTLLMALQLVPGILDKMRGEDDEADE